MPHSAEHTKHDLADPWMPSGFDFGRLRIEIASGPAEMDAVQRLRAARFRGGHGSDLDRFDTACQHLLVRALPDGAPVAAARLRLLADPQTTAESYTAQFYDLGKLAKAGFRLMEIGRICIVEGQIQDPDILRALLAGLTRRAVALRAQMLVGCASFPGATVARHAAALRHLAAHSIGPEALRPRRRAGTQIIDLPREEPAEGAAGLRGMPPLLRMYLGMGGWVSDHAVCDPDLDTLHVFTAVEPGRIPPARLRALCALAGGRLFPQPFGLS